LSAQEQRIDPLLADAIHLTSADDLGAVLVCSTSPAALERFVRDGQALTAHSRIAGGDQLAAAGRLVAQLLGVASENPFATLDRLSIGGETAFADEMTAAMRWDRANGITVDSARLRRLIEGVAQANGGRLQDAASLNTKVQDARRALSASFTHGVAQIVSGLVEDIAAHNGAAKVGLSGDMVSNPRLTSAVSRAVGERLFRAAVPERVGRALGAALSAESVRPADDAALTLGPAFSDYDIKRTLDNCRLDYVYEPEWERLIARVSNMLSQGKVIGWFQGPMAFGPRPLGTRSVLCDPSGRYARQNVNEYLRQRPLDEPLPVVFASSLRDECLSDGAIRPPGVVDATVKTEWRERLVSALDWRHQVRVQSLNRSEAPALSDLLERHFERTRVPGLIEIPLGGVGQPMACSPRDAVRTVYSSAIDALVIGRFLLMKDYWLLRSDVS
jgi:carbamoyltransferase